MVWRNGWAPGAEATVSVGSGTHTCGGFAAMQVQAGERLAGWSEGNWNSSSFRCIAGYAAVGRSVGVVAACRSVTLCCRTWRSGECVGCLSPFLYGAVSTAVWNLAGWFRAKSRPTGNGNTGFTFGSQIGRRLPRSPESNGFRNCGYVVRHLYATFRNGEQLFSKNMQTIKVPQTGTFKTAYE